MATTGASVVQVRFTVKDADLGLDLSLGERSLNVPVKPNTPRKEILELRSVPMDLLGEKPPDSTLTVGTGDRAEWTDT